jgi:hypothetical protein
VSSTVGTAVDENITGVTVGVAEGEVVIGNPEGVDVDIVTVVVEKDSKFNPSTHIVNP